MGFILEASGAFHWKCYSSVDIATGQPLKKLKHDGTPLRVQQSCILSRKNDEFTSKKCAAVMTLAAAKAKEIEEWEKAQEQGEAAPPDPSMTVTDFYNDIFLPWLKSQVETTQKSHATLVTYKRYWDTYLADHFNGTKTLKNYRPYLGVQFLQDLRQDDGQPYGEATIKHIHSTASGIFSRAVEKDYIDHNPWRDIKVASVAFVNAEQGEAFTEKDVETMIANLESDRNGRSDWNVQMAQCVLAVGIWAGLRPSEIAALQWQSVNLDDETITVRKAYVYGKEKATTKTGKERIVPFRDKLTPILKMWWGVNSSPESGWVFPNRDGNPVNMNTLSDRIIRPNCEKTGMIWKESAFYALRRGYGSLLVQAGWSCEEVAQAMGNTRDVVWKYYFVDKKCELAANARERERGQERQKQDRDEPDQKPKRLGGVEKLMLKAGAQ